MSIPLKQSTAGQIIALGQFCDPSALGTTKDALSIANTDIKLLKWGSTSLASKNSGGATFLANGIYYATLDSTDSNTVGAMSVFSTMSSSTTQRVECIVYPPLVWDSLFGGTDKLQVDAVEINSSAPAAVLQKNILLNATITGTCGASPSPSATVFATGLTGSSYPDNCFRNAALVWTSGLNVGLTPRVVQSFVSSTGLVTMATALPVVPTAGDTFILLGVAI